MQWFIQKVGARATLLWDRFHRIMNDVSEGEAEAGLVLTRLEWVCLIKLRIGPFDKQKNHQILRSAAKDLRTAATCENPVSTRSSTRLRGRLVCTWSPTREVQLITSECGIL